MHIFPINLRFARQALLIAATCSLASCAWLESTPPRKPAPVRLAESESQPEAYVKNIALAQLALTDSDDTATALSRLKAAQTYSLHKKAKPSRQIVAVLEYRLKNAKTMQKLVVPVNTLSENLESPPAMEVMHRFAATPSTLHDISVASAMVTPAGPLKLSDASPKHLQQVTDQQQQHLLKTAANLPPLEDARIQLQLVRFFIDQRFRDAAYLSTENVKQLLASAQQHGGDAATIQSLLHDMEELEGELHKTMPYTLSQVDAPSLRQEN